MKILAIETSCDETSVAIIETSGARRQPTVRVLAHLVSSQIELHAKFGGVVPNLAKREHQRLLVPLLVKALTKSKIKSMLRTGIRGQKANIRFSAEGGSAFGGKNQNQIKKILEREPELLAVFERRILSLSIPDIDVIAVTYGPGLAPALWVGINFAKALALVWKKPIMPMNHMKGHLFSALLQYGKKNDQFSIFNFQKNKKLTVSIPHITFPLLGLLVSGGHTELVLMKKFGRYEIIGETLDDAAGEAFDKVARMLDLGYPGGPAIADAAQIQKAKGKRQNESIAPYAKHVIARSSSDEAISISEHRLRSLSRVFEGPTRNGSATKITFPRPMMQSSDFNFSFSGLKTSVLYFIRDVADKKSVRILRPAIAKEFQDAVVDVLVAKTIRAAQQYKAKTIILGGGVSANRLLRERLAREVKEKCAGAELFLPHPSLTGDNALMIAFAAAIDGKKKAPDKIGAEANMRL